MHNIFKLCFRFNKPGSAVNLPVGQTAQTLRSLWYFSWRLGLLKLFAKLGKVSPQLELLLEVFSRGSKLLLHLLIVAGTLDEMHWFLP